MRVYNLLNAENAISNIKKRRLKASRVHDLNDPFELLHFNLRNKKIRDLFKSEKDRINDEFGILCFSQSYENPVMWSHYGDKHKGICLGFDVPDNVLKLINYVSELKDIPIKSDASRSEFAEIINENLLCTKFDGWRYEREVRTVVNLNETIQDSGMNFVEFSDQLKLREVIIGPRCDVSIQSVSELVNSYKDLIYIIKSRIAFTKFSVVEDRKFRQRRTS